MKLLKKLVFPLAGVLSFSLWINTSASVENLPDCSRNPQPLGKTREQLGEKYREYLLKAKKEISSLPIDMSVKFPLGIICPLRIGDTLENPNSQQPNPKLEAIGFVEQTTGKAKVITSASLIEMLDKNLEVVNQRNSTLTPTESLMENIHRARDRVQNNSNIQIKIPLPSENRSTPSHSQIPPATENGSTPSQSQNMAVIDLIAIDSQTKQVYLLPDILFISFFRDAFNASLNKKVIPNTYDVNRLDLHRLQEQPQPEELSPSTTENQPLNSYDAAIRTAIQKLYSISPNTKVKIPMPSDAPIPPRGETTETLPSRQAVNSLNHQYYRYNALGTINPHNRVSEPIRVVDLIQMFTAHLRGRGDINHDVRLQETYSSQETNVREENTRNSSASHSEQEVYTIYTIDLILYDTRDGQTYLVPDVDLNAFERDALNAVLNDKLIIDTEP